MNDYGRFLVSTKCGVARYLILFLCSGFFIGMAIWFMMNSEKIIRSFTRDFDNKTIGVIIPLALIGFLLAYPIILILAYRSHCLVYENAVVGITTMSNNEKSLQKYVLSCDQIVNVTLSKSVIQIYSSYSTFQVLGGSNRAEAIHEIRSRMRGIAGAIPDPFHFFEAIGKLFRKAVKQMLHSLFHVKTLFPESPRSPYIPSYQLPADCVNL